MTEWTQETWTKEMLTLMELLDRTEEVGDCIEWQGGYSHHKACAYVDRSRVMVRRFVAEADGLNLTNKRAINKCNNYRCICPEHTTGLTISQAMRHAGKKVNIPKRVLSITATRRKTSKITEEIAQQIRDSTDNNMVEAEKHGIHHTYVSLIRRNKAFRPGYMVSNNPFSQLLRMAA